MGLELKFEQIKGDPEKPFGIAGYYVPNISDLNRNLLVIGGNPFKINVSDYKLELYVFSDALKEIMLECRYKKYGVPIFLLPHFIGEEVEQFSSYFPGDLFKATNGFKINSYLTKHKLDYLIKELIEEYVKDYFVKHKLNLGPIRDDETLADLPFKFG